MGLFDKTVVSMLSVTCLSNSAYAIVAPFLPFEFERKGISQTYMGYVFAIYSLAVIIFSPICGSMIGKIGRINLIRIGVTCMGLSFIALGAASLIEDKTTFITISLVTRFFQGFASSAIQTTCYSISTNFYPDHKEALVGYIEAVTGIGLIMGPLIGTLLYSLGGYAFTFYAFASFFVVFFFFIGVLFPSHLN
jgi:MFS family permease